MDKINFTKKSLDALTPSKKGSRLVVGDKQESALRLYVTSTGVKTFYVRKRVEGRDEKIVLGNYPDISIESARNKAAKAKSQIADGVNPNDVKRSLREELTLGQFFQKYMDEYSKLRKKSWHYDEREIPKFLGHWFDRKLSSIKHHEVLALHQKITRENGPYQANRLLERLRGMYNRAIEWRLVKDNPTTGIKKNPEKSRDRFMQPDEMPRFFAALNELTFPETRDYILLSLLLGARKSNMLMMRWEQINWDMAIWRIPDTKNNEPLIVALPPQALKILRARRAVYDQPSSEFESKADKEIRESKRVSPWVFPNPTNGKSHLKDPGNAWDSIMKKSGITDLRIHDLRRTLGSWLAIGGASMPIIGKSLGHKSQQSTQVYARLNLDPVRLSVEKAAEAMLNAAQQKPLAEYTKNRYINE